MSIRALNLGLSKASLLAEPKGNELLYHLRLVQEGNHTDLAKLEMKEVIDNDDCEIYHKNNLLAVTSTQELEVLMRAATLNTFKMIEVRTENEMYYAAVEESLLKRQYVGVLTDDKSRVTAFVQCINGTYWAVNGKRLIHLDMEIAQPTIELRAQDCIRYINKYPEQFKDANFDVVLFK